MSNISFIVSSFNKPIPLITCISSLRQQAANVDIVVCDNSIDTNVRKANATYSHLFGATYIDTSAECPPEINAGYKAQNIGARSATGDWLCFPSEDCYYVPGFTKTMLDAAELFRASFVYCDMLYDPRYNQVASEGIYAVVPSYPRFRFMDKSNFIVKRGLFKGFEDHPNGYGDWIYIQSLIARDIHMAKAAGVLMVKN